MARLPSKFASNPLLEGWINVYEFWLLWKHVYECSFSVLIYSGRTTLMSIVVVLDLNRP